jgi:hypothetical protein
MATLELDHRLPPSQNCCRQSYTGAVPSIFATEPLPEETRRDAVERIDEYTIDWMDAGVFVDAEVRSLLTDDEFVDLSDRFKTEWMHDVEKSLRHWRYNYYSSDELGHFCIFKDNLERAETLFCNSQNARAFARVYEELDELISDLEPEPGRRESSGPAQTTPTPAGSATAIFDDIDA